MTIHCDLYWKSEDGQIFICHEYFNEEDLFEFMENKEEDKTFHGIPVQLDSVICDKIDL